jgi:hypothetical protein
MDKVGFNLGQMANELEALFDEQCNVEGAYDLTSEMYPVTWGIILRMDAIYKLNNAMKRILNKRVASIASDQFTEALAWFIAVAARSNGFTDITVRSEKELVPKVTPALRPDISIWRGDRCLAVVEAKTQLGWSRSTWKSDFQKRAELLKNQVADLTVLHVVLTNRNWSGLNPADAETGREWFTLCDGWPGSSDTLSVINPIESVLKDVFTKV